MSEVPIKQSRLQKVKEFFRPPDPMQRISDSWGILKEVGGFRQLFNVRDLEQRRLEIKGILDEIEGKTHTEELQFEVVDKTFKLFFLSGSAWYRGLDNREITTKVSKYLRLYNEVRHLPAFLGDLFMCSMHLLHLSFQALDVTNTPGYIIQVTNPQGHPNAIMPTENLAPREQKPDRGAYPRRLKEDI